MLHTLQIYVGPLHTKELLNKKRKYHARQVAHIQSLPTRTILLVAYDHYALIIVFVSLK